MSVSEGERTGTGASSSSGVANVGSDFGKTIVDNLARAGVQNGYRNERLKFDTLEAYPDGAWVAATGTYTDAAGAQRLVAVSIGPEQGTLAASR